MDEPKLNAMKQIIVAVISTSIRMTTKSIGTIRMNILFLVHQSITPMAHLNLNNI